MNQWCAHAEILSLRLLQRCLWGWEGGVGFVQGRKHGEGRAAMSKTISHKGEVDQEE